MAPARLLRPLDPIYVGATWQQPIQFLNEDRTPRDMTGKPVTFALNRKGLPSASRTVEGVDQGDGLLLFEVDEEPSEPWVAGRYAIEVTVEDGDDVLSVLVGDVLVLKGAAAGGVETSSGSSQSLGVPGVVISATGAVQIVFVDRVVIEGSAVTIDDIPGLRDLLTDYEERIAALEAGEPPVSGGSLDFSNPINSALIGAL